MIIQTPDRTLESNGLQEQGSFNIKTSPAAFLMLSSGLYTNKIKAVLREIGCNALDAHKMNGNEAVPIEVKLPNNLDRQFYIKDFGPGLSHEQVMKLYTTYFESSKQDSDDFIGGFGVGSKSPFAYTDTFTVESRHNGVKRLYTAFVGGNGIPSIAKMMEEETTEPNGLSVGFPVRDSDVAAFEEESVQVFSWFEPRPNVLGSLLDWSRADAKEQMGSVTVFEGGNVPGNYNQPVLRMGGVAYPMGDFWRQYEQTFGRECDPAVAALGRFPVAFNVPIGTSNVAASREALQFDKLSLERVHAALVPVAAEFAAHIVDRMTKPKRFFERIDFAHNWFKKMQWSHRNVTDLLKATSMTAKLDGVIEASQNRYTKIDPAKYPSITFVRLDDDLQTGMVKITQRRSYPGLTTYSGLQSMRRKLTTHITPPNPDEVFGSTEPWDVLTQEFRWNLNTVEAHIYDKALPAVAETGMSVKECWPFIHHLVANNELVTDRRIWLTPTPGVAYDAFLAEVMSLSDELGLQPRSYITPPEPAREVNARPAKVLMGFPAERAHYSERVKKAARSLAKSSEGRTLPEDEPILCILYKRKALLSYQDGNLNMVVNAHRAMTSGNAWTQFAELTGLPEKERVYFVPEEDWDDIVAANPEAMNWEEIKQALKDDQIMYHKILMATEKPAGQSIDWPMSSWLQHWRELEHGDALGPITDSLFHEIMARWNIEANASDEYNRAMNLRKEANNMVGWQMPTGVQLNRSSDFKQLKERYPMLVHAINNANNTEIVDYIVDREYMTPVRAAWKAEADAALATAASENALPVNADVSTENAPTSDTDMGM